MTLTLEIPEDLQGFVEERTQSGKHPSPAAYIEYLLRYAQQGKEATTDNTINTASAWRTRYRTYPRWKRIIWRKYQQTERLLCADGLHCNKLFL